MNNYKDIEVNYKFFLPQHNEELRNFQNVYNYISTLNEIYNKCRSILKYKENPTESEIELAEDVENIINDSRIFYD